MDRTIRLFSAPDGQAALEFFNTCCELPHLIFLDLNMPRMGGKECLLELKGDKRLADIPVLIYFTSLERSSGYFFKVTLIVIAGLGMVFPSVIAFRLCRYLENEDHHNTSNRH